MRTSVLRSKWLVDLASTGRSCESVLRGPSFARPSPNPSRGLCTVYWCVLYMSWSSRPRKFPRTEDLVILDLSAETSYSQAMYFAEEAAQFCELLTASYSYLSVGSDAFRLNNIFQQVWQNVFKKNTSEKVPRPPWRFCSTARGQSVVAGRVLHQERVGPINDRGMPAQDLQSFKDSMMSWI